jgi:hypothetical protein
MTRAVVAQLVQADDDRTISVDRIPNRLGGTDDVEHDRGEDQREDDRRQHGRSRTAASALLSPCRR